MGVIFAILAGMAALTSQPQALPEDFVQGAIGWSVPIQTEGFIGLAWVCDPATEGVGWKADYGPTPEQVIVLRAAAVADTTEQDVCYAGIDLPSGKPVTGP